MGVHRAPSARRTPTLGMFPVFLILFLYFFPYSTVPLWYVDGASSKALWKTVREGERHSVLLPDPNPLDWLLAGSLSAA